MITSKYLFIQIVFISQKPILLSMILIYEKRETITFNMIFGAGE